MTKYLRVTFNSIALKSVSIPHRVQSLFKRTHSIYNDVDSSYENNDSDHIKQQRLLKVAIIGIPNAGKSSLINSLMDRYTCAISSKVHTTRSSKQLVLVENDTQIVFLDTPGLVDSQEISKFNLEKSFASGSVNAIGEADIIGVIHDVSNRYTRNRLDPKVLRLLHLNAHKESFLILNKIDVPFPKIRLLALARTLTCFKLDDDKVHISDGNLNCNMNKLPERKLNQQCKQNIGWEKFKDVFMVSALTGSGIKDIKSYLLEKSKPAPWIFPKNMLTDTKNTDLLMEIINGCLYDDLPNEVPYNLDVELEYYEISREGSIHAVVLIGCDTPRIEKLVMGKSGKRIRNIALKAEQNLRNFFYTDVFLKLVVTKKHRPIEQSEADALS